MTYRESFSNIGRPSPYGLGRNDRSFSDLYEYVPVDDDRRSEGQLEDDNAPDVIKFIDPNDRSYKAEFVPFAISESRVFVGDLRLRVSRQLDQDPRKIRIYYKGTELVGDGESLKSYGCKQNSEVEIKIDHRAARYGDSDNYAVADDGYNAPAEANPRLRANSAARNRRTSYYVVDQNSTPRSSDFLHPEEHVPKNRPHRSGSTNRPAPTRVRREPSPATAAPTATPLPTSPRRPSRPVDPDSPIGKVFAIRDKLESQYLPEAEKFLASPPRDQSVRQNTYNQVVENFMKHVIEAADSIMTEGDKEARAERKKLITTAQDVLKDLDTAHKSWAR